MRTHNASSISPTYKSWLEESMKSAYSAVKNDELNIKQASEKYNVPYSTLSDRVHGRVRFGSHSGPTRYVDDLRNRTG